MEATNGSGVSEIKLLSGHSLFFIIVCHEFVKTLALVLRRLAWKVCRVFKECLG